MIVTTGAFALEDGFLSYFIVNCLAFSVTGLLFIASAFDLLKTQEDMRQFVSRIYIFTHFEKKCKLLRSTYIYKIYIFMYVHMQI